VQFELSAELTELAATVRKLSQERVAPRARAIDESEAARRPNTISIFATTEHLRTKLVCILHVGFGYGILLCRCPGAY
jgi:hypothetical protein